jgi:hypothetical protein
MTSRIAITISVLTLGTALAAVPSFAQMRGEANGPEVQQESTGNVPQQQSTPCVHFQQGCSDKPYPMAQSASPNSERTSAASRSRERLSSERTGREQMRVRERERTGRERAGVNERERVGINERDRLSSERMASGRERISGETYGAAGPRYMDEAPGMRVARAGNGPIAWCETRFHSFEPATGTYLGFDGIRHACP